MEGLMVPVLFIILALKENADTSSVCSGRIIWRMWLSVCFVAIIHDPTGHLVCEWIPKQQCSPGAKVPPENSQALLPIFPILKMCIKYLFWNCHHWHRRLLALAVARSTPQRCSWLTHHKEIMQGQGMQIPDDEISSRLSHIMNLCLQSWAPRQAAGSVVGLYKRCVQDSHIMGTSSERGCCLRSSVQWFSFSWILLIIYPRVAWYYHQIIWSFILFLHGIATRLPAIRDALDLLLTRVYELFCFLGGTDCIKLYLLGD